MGKEQSEDPAVGGFCLRGQEKLRKRYIARRKSIFIFKEAEAFPMESECFSAAPVKHSFCKERKQIHSAVSSQFLSFVSEPTPFGKQPFKKSDNRMLC